MHDRPAKLPAMAVNVAWASRKLTLAEKVVFYHDWCLDQEGADASYIAHETMATDRLGGSLTAGTVSRVRQRLKRLTLHEPIRRRDARNLGWVSTLPRHCIPRTYREVGTCATALDEYLVSLTAWSEQNGPESPVEVDSRVQTEQTPESRRAAALGGRGEPSALGSVLQAQLPSAFREKGAGAYAPEDKKVERDPSEVRAEGWALIHLRQGKKLTPEERRLVDAYLLRYPDRRKAVGE